MRLKRVRQRTRRKRARCGFTLIALLACPCVLHGQIPARDSRNTRIPHTDTHFAMPVYETLEEWEQRKDHLRKQILSAAGLLPMPAKQPLRAQVFGRVEHESYSTEKVLIESLPGYYLGGNLYRPLTPGRHAGVLVAHGHSRYGRFEHQHRSHSTVQGAEGQARENRYPDQIEWSAPLVSYPALAANLAMQGYVVFAWDMVGYNDTAQTPHSFGGPREQLWSFGPMGLQLWNSTRALDFLESLPDVDGERIGMTGASGGGTQTFLLAAVDERVKCSAPVGMVSGVMQGGSACQNAPGLRHGTFNVEFAAMAAPRPMLLVSTPVDQTRNTPREEFPAIRRIYDLFDRGGNVETVEIDAPHNYNRFSREAVYRFFAKHLHPDAGSVDTAEQEIQLPRGLQDLLALYNRTRPPNALSYGELFRQWRETSAAQIDSIREKRVLREYLQRSLSLEWPEQVIHEINGDEILLSRPSAGDRVPGLWFAGDGRPALVVHPEGSAAAMHAPTVEQLLRSNRPVLLIDSFQTGRATDRRTWTHQASRPHKGHYLTFNRSDDANRLQDVVTALSFLVRAHGEVELVGLEDASLWSLVAAAASPSPVRLTMESSNFPQSDAELVQTFFVPGLQRVGGLRTALRLTQAENW